MAYTNVAEASHLSTEQIEELGRELDAIRKQIEDSRGAKDAAYIRRMITVQRRLAAAGRITLFAAHLPPAWFAGTLMLGVAKILENMEIGHNVMHGQWDWMNDPEIHSSNWEWDTMQPADQWKHSHNFVHHHFTNVLGKDGDIGYGILRVTRDQKWHPINLAQPVTNFVLATLFQWGVALHDLDLEAIRKGKADKSEVRRKLKGIGRKIRRQMGKDYLLFPVLAGPNAPLVFTANATANLMRNLWSYMIIFCGHFPDGAEHFSQEELVEETQAQWYLRQLFGSADFSGGPLLHILSGNLGFQIEHHMFPDLPSNRYADIAVKVRELCTKYDLPYTTGPLYQQYGQVFRTIMLLTRPNNMIEGRTTPPIDPVSERHLQVAA